MRLQFEWRVWLLLTYAGVSTRSYCADQAAQADHGQLLLSTHLFPSRGTCKEHCINMRTQMSDAQPVALLNSVRLVFHITRVLLPMSYQVEQRDRWALATWGIKGMATRCSRGRCVAIFLRTRLERQSSLTLQVDGSTLDASYRPTTPYTYLYRQ